MANAKKNIKKEWWQMRSGIAAFGLAYAALAYAFGSLAIDSGSYLHYGLALICVYLAVKKAVDFIKAK